APNFVTHFRLHLPLTSKPEKFLVRVTADSVYRLFVNGLPVASGPTSGDPGKWRYDEIDLSPHLLTGDNVLAAVVWHPERPWVGPICMMGKAPGFFLQGESHPMVNTGTGAWRAYVNPAYSPLAAKVNGYYALGDFEEMDGRLYPWGWETAAFDDRDWSKPIISSEKYTLVPREIPPLEHRPERLVRVRKADGVVVPEAFLAGKHPVVVPPQTKATILLDRGELINAYPELTISGGRGGRVKMGYAEALFGEKNMKGDRDVVEAKKWVGAADEIIADGGTNRLYRALWFRTFRYLQLEIQTADEPLTLVDLRGEFTGYPFVERAAFDAGDAELKRIWDVGWRTLRLCAVDNFYDCPYYERLQYAGDTRIEALVSVYVSGDDRLMRKAIDLFNDSLGDEGLTASRYPSKLRQIIPTFCNWWIAMIDDYRLLNGDKEFIRKLVPAMETVLKRFETYTDPETGLITFSRAGEWDFVDWAGHLSHGKERKEGARATSGLISLNHIYALDRAAEIMRYLGDETKAKEYQTRSERIRNAVYARCWDNEKGILADDPRMNRYTEHMNLLGILTDAIPPAQQRAVMEKILNGEPKMTKATIYFRFYYNRALVKTGLADRYLDTLGVWRDQLKLNLTTWAESPEPSRSDCHAWGSSPNYEFLATVAGITPAAPGFARVRIAPALGALKTITARMPHARGMIEVQLQRAGAAGITGVVTLPSGLSGTFEWGGNTIALKPGKQSVKVK
ncbi:MAG: family 78 glycoside hydrolase catalytic domain, partial [Akkermansiaceae bacterium]|nr:family 78 glycoside hydrolase catalytic domain [Akkermansiaceae bacterium]